MVRESRYSRGVYLLATAASVLGITNWESRDDDPDGLGLIARTFVWARWFILAFGLVLWVYRPVDWLETYALYVPGLLLLVGLNGYTHYRLATRKAVTRGWILLNATLDVFILSSAVAAGGGFGHHFLYLLYYPQLAGYAVVLTSFRLTMASATFVAVLYLAISLTVGDGIDTAATEERTLLARILVMYAVATIVNIIARFERVRWRRAVERERDLQRERVEFSQTVHDTTAQSAYMIGLGIDTARAQAGATNPELAATLEATSRLSRSTIWELRHPIHMGGIYEGQCAELRSEVPRRQLHQHHRCALRADSDRSRATPLDGDPGPALLDRPQRAHQRLPPCGSEQGGDPPGLRGGGAAAIGVG